jgi:starch synthase
MRILMIASECTPFAKTGGLADVVGALPQALVRLGHEVRIAIPLYRTIKRDEFRMLPLLRQVEVHWGSEILRGGVMRCPYPSPEDVPVYFIQQDELFDRAGLYGEANRDYPDNDRRFAFFCQACLWMLKGLHWQPDILHLHDWQAALIAPLLRFHPVVANDLFYGRMRTVFTIHNLAYQGNFDPNMLPLASLPWRLFASDGMEFFQHVSLLKGGLVYADMLTTVSPRYSLEIQTDDFGAGMQGVLRRRSADLVGILNGIDERVWDPASDPLLPSHYSTKNLAGKARCREELCKAFALRNDPSRPIIGMVSRLVDQKGFDLVRDAMDEILASGACIALVGTGDPACEQYFRRLSQEQRGRVGAALAYREDLAHLVEAGSDIFLMPSRFEPSGLNQLYSMRYGTLPLVRKVGGLADSVTDATPANILNGTATGFVFEEYTVEAMLEAYGRALELFTKQPDKWKAVMLNAMNRDSSWDAAASAYVDVYERAIQRKPITLLS